MLSKLFSNRPPKQPISNCIAKADSGASDHYLRECDEDCLKNIQSFNGPHVTLPNNSQLQATRHGDLPFSDLLSKEAKTGVILPGLHSSSLVSLGKLCDDGCEILLNDRKMYAVKNNTVVLEGQRNPYDRLWDIPVQKNTITPCNTKHFIKHAGLYHLTGITNKETTHPRLHIATKKKRTRANKTFHQKILCHHL